MGKTQADRQTNTEKGQFRMKHRVFFTFFFNPTVAAAAAAAETT